MRLFEYHRLWKVFRRLRKTVCLCAGGEADESDSRYELESASPSTDVVNNSETAMDNLGATSDQTSATVDQYSTTVDHYTTAMDNLGATSDQISATVDQYSTTVDHYTTAMGHYTTAVDHYTTAMDNLAATPDQASATVDQYTTTVDHYTTAMGHYTTAVDQYTTAMDNLATTPDQASATVDQYTTTVDHYTTAMGHYTTAVDHYTTTVNHCTATVENESPVEVPPLPDKEPQITSEDIMTNVSADDCLKQEVEHFINEIEESILTDMEAEDVQATCVPAELCMRTESQETVLSRTNMESSSTEFYSCVSETIPSDTSLPCSMTSFHSLETKINEERSHETFITPQDSSIDELLVECATAKTAITTSKEASVASLVNNKDLFVNNNDLLVNNNDLLVNNNDLLVNNNDLLVNNNDLLVNNSSSTVSECSESHSEQTARIHSSYSQMPSCQDSQLNIVRGQRSEMCVFEVKLVGGLLGLGLTLGSDEMKEVVIEKIRFISPAATQGELRVGDRVMRINGRSIIGKSPLCAQSMLNQTKWGEEVNIWAMPPQDTVIFHFSETTNAGVIIMKLNTSLNTPLGVDIEGGSDTESPYIHISGIKPGSMAERCSMLRVGDELVEINEHLMVGSTHDEAIDILRHIHHHQPITLTVQRRHSLNLQERIHSHQSQTSSVG